jgi:hypothetical protein
MNGKRGLQMGKNKKNPKPVDAKLLITMINELTETY